MSATPLVTITPREDDDQVLVIRHEPTQLERLVDCKPNPTWPTPDEIASDVADAVRQVMRQAWELEAGIPGVGKEKIPAGQPTHPFPKGTKVQFTAERGMDTVIVNGTVVHGHLDDYDHANFRYVQVDLGTGGMGPTVSVQLDNLTAKEQTP